jgi:hypothetical protein
MGATALSADVRLAVGAIPARRGSVAAESVRAAGLWRAIRWQPAAGGCAAAAVRLAWGDDTTGQLGLLRGLLLLVLLGVVFVLDDPGARVVEAVPVPWCFRLTLRSMVSLLIVGVTYMVLWVLLGNDVRIRAGVGLEVVTILAVGPTDAAVAVRYAGACCPALSRLSPARTS